MLTDGVLGLSHPSGSPAINILNFRNRSIWLAKLREKSDLRAILKLRSIGTSAIASWSLAIQMCQTKLKVEGRTMIKKVIDWVAENRADSLEAFNEKLNPPATQMEIQEVEAELGHELPVEFYQAYLVANGMRGFSDISLWRMMSLEEIKKCHQAMAGQTVFDDSLTEYAWNSAWVPFAVDRTGDWAGINLQSDDSGDEVPDCLLWSNVFVLRHDENCLRSHASSFASWAEEWIDDMVELER